MHVTKKVTPAGNKMDQDVGKVNSYQHRNIFASNYEETRSHEIIVRNPNNKITLHTKYCFTSKAVALIREEIFKISQTICGLVSSPFF